MTTRPKSLSEKFAEAASRPVPIEGFNPPPDAAARQMPSDNLQRTIEAALARYEREEPPVAVWGR